MRIDSKDKGLTPLIPYGTQNYFLEEVCKGLAEDIHFFYVLKARQQGISTICLALDNFWLSTNPGIQGSLITDTDQNRDNFRSILDGYIQSLPKSLRIPIKTHNRNFLEYRNRSKLIYQVAGTKVKGQRNTLGQAKGLNYCHGTEISSWADAEATANFIASLSDTFPGRLYIFESTAKGLNDFYERWQDAKNAVSKGTIFIGWWRMDSYRAERDSVIFHVYGGDPPSGEEMLWIDQVKFLYGYEITKEQLAWWRWKLAEDIKDDNLMMQFYPPTEEHAFILSGHRFFDRERLRKVEIACKQYAPAWYRYKFGPTFDLTEIYATTERMGQLAVWEEPDPNGYYVIGADPAFGSSYDADRYCAQVWRCYTNRVEQVATYCTTEGNCYQFAWVIAHLCGAYRNRFSPSIMVLEINGPGKAVLDEFFRLQQYPQYVGRNSNGLHDVVSGIMNYLYSRADSLQSTYNYHWKTTSDLKEYIFNLFRDAFESDQMIIKDPELVQEMCYIAQEDGQIGSSTNAVKDDRVIATALVIEGWKKLLLPQLFDVGMSYEASQTQVYSNTPITNVLGYKIQNFMKQFRREEIEQ